MHLVMIWLLWLWPAPGAAAEARPLRAPVLIEENGGQFAAADVYGVALGEAEIGFGREITYRHEDTRLAMWFERARPRVQPVAEGRSSTMIHAYHGRDRGRWRENLGAYTAVRYPQLYPGIDLLFHTKSGELEYDFQVAPRVNPRAIRLRFRGARRLSLNYEGDLLVELANGKVLRHQRPVAYQTIEGRKCFIPAFYSLDRETVSFRLARYDARRPLVIDPVLRFATVVDAQLSRLASDGASNTFVGGTFGSGILADLVYWKFNAAGGLVYKVYLGGVGEDRMGKMAADAAGNLFVTGSSNSSDYPVHTSPCRGPNFDVVLTKLGPTGVILASRCFGGLRNETAVGIGVDANGFVYVGGETDSYDYPATAGAFQTQTKAPDLTNGFVAKFDPATLAVVSSTLIGGSGATEVHDMAMDSTGAVVLVGGARPIGFPVTPGAVLTSIANGHTVPRQAYVARIASSGSTVLYATYLPITLLLEKLRVGVDGNGQAVVAAADVQNTIHVLKLSASGGQLQFSKVLPKWGAASTLEVDTAGNLLLVGEDTNAINPTAESLQGRRGVMMIVKLDPTASNVLYASPIFGLVREARFAPGGDMMAIVELNNLYRPQGFPITPGAFSDLNAGQVGTSFGVFRIALGNAVCSPILSANSLSIPNIGMTGTLDVTAPANCTWVASVIQDPADWITFNGNSFGTGNGTISFTAKQLTAPETGRRATIFASPTASTVLTQGVQQACVTNPLPSGVSIAGGPSVYSQFFLVPNTCPWSVTSDAAWLRVLSPANGTGQSTIFFAVDANPGSARTGNLILNGQVIGVTQGDCGYAVGAGTLESRAGTIEVAVNAATGCPWTISVENAPWLRLNIDASTVREGPATLTAEVDDNPGGTLRMATIKLAGRAFTVQQSGTTCQYVASATQTTFPSNGGITTMTVTASSGCNPVGTVGAPGAITATANPTAGTGVYTIEVPANSGLLPKAFRATGGFLPTAALIPLIQDAANPVQPFDDVPLGHTFFNHIAILKDRQVTRGCTFDARSYCPQGIVTRAEMATFLARALNLGGGGGEQFFEDVPPTHPHYAAIQAIRVRGITFGCATLPDRYCPDQALTRGQMAALIVRAIMGDTFHYSGVPSFLDVTPAYGFFRHVQKMKELGVTLGCTPQTYCPDSLTTRGEMAAFLVRAFLSNPQP